MDNKDRELADLKARAANWVRYAQRHRLDAAEHLSDAAWSEVEVNRLQRKIAELEARDRQD